jgi:hypothetical protein
MRHHFLVNRGEKDGQACASSAGRTVDALRTKRRSILLRTFPRRSAAFLDLLGRLDRRRCSSVFCFLGKSKRLKTCPLCRAYCAFIFQLLAEERITLFRGGEVILGFAARSGAPVFIAFAHVIPFRL